MLGLDAPRRAGPSHASACRPGDRCDRRDYVLNLLALRRPDRCRDGAEQLGGTVIHGRSRGGPQIGCGTRPLPRVLPRRRVVPARHDPAGPPLGHGQPHRVGGRARFPCFAHRDGSRLPPHAWSEHRSHNLSWTLRRNPAKPVRPLVDSGRAQEPGRKKPCLGPTFALTYLPKPGFGRLVGQVGAGNKRRRAACRGQIVRLSMIPIDQLMISKSAHNCWSGVARSEGIEPPTS